ncbi:unnamed protein product [Rhizophagus irregularis]|nr:unnamed protein product [Rhizophagus irregularis]CAB5368390.1 unnamed protein product [Rhizophagus irregularis]
MPKTSSSQIYDHIKFCISTSCLSRKVRQKSRLMNFIYDVLNVALGIRVAHLVDVTFLTYEETLTFISSLRQKISHIYAIQFSDTHTFICNRDLLLLKLDQDLNNDFKNIIFIDVSKENIEPKQVNVPNSLIYLLNTQVYSTFVKENEKINSILFISQIPQCIISFTGWILEYQVIYILEKNSFEFESQNIIINCLGNQELKLYRIFLKKIDNNNNNNSDKERHMLLSFSCPVKIFNSLNDSQSNKDIISTVLNDTFTFRIEQNQSFWNKGWELEISDVCLPVVAL